MKNQTSDGGTEFVPVKGLNLILVADKRLNNLVNIIKMELRKRKIQGWMKIQQHCIDEERIIHGIEERGTRKGGKNMMEEWK